MDFQLNAYKHYANSNVSSITTSQEWFNLIKKNPYIPTIEEGRRNIHNENVYNRLKAKLPCVTWNFLFDGYRKNKHIIKGTGLMYIDIDTPNFNIQDLDLSKVYAYYHSFGGIHYAVIVKVEGLKLGNFNATYKSICTELGLSVVFDKGAKKATQPNVLSYDENIYVNNDSYTFKAIANNEILAPASSVYLKKQEAYTHDTGASDSDGHNLRFNDLDEIYIEGEYKVDWDGIEYTNCFIPRRKISSGRQNMFLSYTANLVYLNRQITKEAAFDRLETLNFRGCENPADAKQLWGVVDAIFKQKQAGTLQHSINPKKRKIVFDIKSRLTKDEKQIIVISEIAKMRIRKSKQKLHNIIEGWDFSKYGKITQRTIYNNHEIGKHAVEKYYKEFAEIISAMNANKGDLKPVAGHVAQSEPQERTGREFAPNEAESHNVSNDVMTVNEISKGEQEFGAMAFKCVDNLKSEGITATISTQEQSLEENAAFQNSGR